MFRRLALATLLFCASVGTLSGQCSAAQLSDVEHIIVIYLENHSFDNLFGLFPNADGLAAAGATKVQVDKNGRPYDFLPRAMQDFRDERNVNQFRIDLRFPDDLPNQPFSIDAYVPIGDNTGDPIHRFYHQQAQIDGGLMDKFVAYSNMGALVMGFYDGSKTKLWEYAEHYTLADHFFHAAFGGSFLNHFWMICACTPRYENAPDTLTIGSDVTGPLRGLPDQVTPDGYAVNTLEPFDPPQRKGGPRLPLQTMKTIGDELNDAKPKVTWAWYAGGWNDALKADRLDENFQTHHQPFAYFENYRKDSDGRREHLKDEEELLQALDGLADFPQVVFYKPFGRQNEHPGYANVLEGDQHVGELLCKIEKSQYWSKSIVIVTFDENGGYWDHVPPPHIDRWGPGVRVPTVIISPYAKKGFIDHTTYDTTAILKLIENRYGLDSLGKRDKNSKDLTAALDFSEANASLDNRVCKPEAESKPEPKP
ncbi:MAG TPA: alkaline phosphatase family protein [Methyloceanibacter sp.]|nr:alkaline phosphatase family protein [Methyloceanibacter sp.]